MRFYENVVLPRLTDLVMRSSRLAEVRARLLAPARGEVLEIGSGSGLNLPFYGGEVTRVIGIDPSPGLTRLARRAHINQGLGHQGLRVDLVIGSAENLPLADNSIDTAVSTWTLCSIPNPVQALREVRRVLRRDGRLLFVEHGLAPEAAVSRWQHRLTPYWKRCAGGCHLNRPMAEIVTEAGFTVTALQTGYMAGPRILTYLYEGEGM